MYRVAAGVGDGEGCACGAAAVDSCFRRNDEERAGMTKRRAGCFGYSLKGLITRMPS